MEVPRRGWRRVAAGGGDQPQMNAEAGHRNAAVQEFETEICRVRFLLILLLVVICTDKSSKASLEANLCGSVTP